jgi:hypothetical protein
MSTTQEKGKTAFLIRRLPQCVFLHDQPEMPCNRCKKLQVHCGEKLPPRRKRENMGRHHTFYHPYDPYMHVRRAPYCRADINASKQEVPILFPLASDLVQSIENQLLNIPLEELFAIARSLSEKGLIGNPSVSDFIISRQWLPTVWFKVEWRETINIRSSINIFYDPEERICKPTTANDVFRHSLYPIPALNITVEHSKVIDNLFSADEVTIDAKHRAVQQKAIEEMSSPGNVQRTNIPLHFILN